jgi:DNA-binding transcriptional regulator YbjK
MPPPARQRFLDAALSLIQRRGIGRVTAGEIAVVAALPKAACSRTWGQNGAAHRAAEL